MYNATLMFEKDISNLAKPEIKGRGFIGSGNEIIETQTYFTQPEKDWVFDEDQKLTYNNPVFTEQCKLQERNWDELNTGWVEQKPIEDVEEIEEEVDEDEFEDDDEFDDEEFEPISKPKFKPSERGKRRESMLDKPNIPPRKENNDRHPMPTPKFDTSKTEMSKAEPPRATTTSTSTPSAMSNRDKVEEALGGTKLKLNKKPTKIKLNIDKKE